MHLYGYATYICNIHMKLWDVTIEELYQTAAENTQRLEKPEFMEIEKVLHNVMKEEGSGLYDHDRFMEKQSDRNDYDSYTEEKRDRNDYAECTEKCSAALPVYVLSNRESGMYALPEPV